MNPGPDLDEEEAMLIAAAQSDPSQFTELYRRHVAGVHALAWSRLGDRAAAEDATAETFRRALRALPRFEYRGTPYRALLWRICTNVANDELRRRQRASRFNVAMPADPPGRSHDDLSRAEDRALVHDLVGRLSTDHQAVIRLRFGEDRAVADVAARLGRSPAAIKQLQRRALAELRTLIAEEHDDVSR